MMIWYTQCLINKNHRKELADIILIEGFRFFIYMLVAVFVYILFIRESERNLHLQEVQEVIKKINDTCRLFHFGDVFTCLKAFLENTEDLKDKYLTELNIIHQGMDGLKQNQSVTSNTLNILQQELKSFSANIIADIKDIRQKFTKIDSHVTEFGKKQSDISLQIAGMGGRQEYMESKLYSPDYLIVIMLVAVFVVIIIMRIVYRIWRECESRKAEKTHIDNFRHAKEEHSSILENIQRRRLENTVTVVSFNDGERQGMHQELTESIADRKIKTYTIKTVCIKTKEDIRNIISKVSFVFVDKNERNIILESKHEIGQHLKSLTVQAILNMGGKAIVVYFLHDGSSKLHTQDLYSPTLTSITSHEWLSKLKKEGCVLSVFTNFTEFQRDHLKQKLEEYLC